MNFDMHGLFYALVCLTFSGLLFPKSVPLIDFSIEVNFLKFNSFLGQVKEDTCYVSDNFLRDMNVAKYVKVYVLFLF